MKQKKKQIVANKARCLICQALVESKHRHDFVTCPCGNLSVDGGLDYLKRIIMIDGKVLELSDMA